jgi:conjugative transfer region protein TrbK
MLRKLIARGLLFALAAAVLATAIALKQRASQRLLASPEPPTPTAHPLTSEFLRRQRSGPDQAVAPDCKTAWCKNQERTSAPMNRAQTRPAFLCRRTEPVFFIVGATLAAFTFEHWRDLPALPPVSLPSALGLGPALMLNLAACAVIWHVVRRLERDSHGAVEPIFRTAGAAFIRGPWPYAWAALALAILNFATLILAGRPWAITQAFALWGSLAIDRTGLGDPVFWAYWDDPTRVEALHRSLLADTMTVMDVGIVIGALLAAGLAGLSAPAARVPLPHLAASVVGGLVLGFGAIVATGCNISAYFSGIASGSLHGWLWIAAALPGNALGARLRPFFSLDPQAAHAPAPSSATALVRP